MAKKTFAAVLVILISAVFAYLYLPLTAVTLLDSEGNVLYAFVPPGDRFTVRFLHSWARSPVDEVFRVDDGQIVLVETSYEDFGAGLPYEPEDGHSLDTMSVENKKIIIRDMERPVPDLQIRTGRFVANHRLLYGKEEVPFISFSVPGSAVIFRVRTLRRWELLKYRAR